MIKNFLILSVFVLTFNFALASLAYAEEDINAAGKTSGEVLIDNTAELDAEAQVEFNNDVNCYEETTYAEDGSEIVSSNCVSDDSADNVDEAKSDEENSQEVAE
jgi:hypothetical protein